MDCHYTTHTVFYAIHSFKQYSAMPLRSNILWSQVSQALRKFKHTQIRYLPYMYYWAFSIWVTALATATNAAWNFLKPNWESHDISHSSINFNKRLYISHSKSVDNTRSIEAGLKWSTFIEFPDSNKSPITLASFMTSVMERLQICKRGCNMMEDDVLCIQFIMPHSTVF